MPDFTDDQNNPVDNEKVPSSIPTSSIAFLVKKLGGAKVVSGVFGMLLLAAGLGAGIILVSQPQLLEQKASQTVYIPSQTVLCGGVDKATVTANCGSMSLVCKNNNWVCGIACTTGNLGSLCSDGCGTGKAAYTIRRADCTTYCDSGINGSNCNHTVSASTCKDSAGNTLSTPTLTCGSLPGGSCGGYESCSLGQGYNACDPIPGTNQCSYKVNGVSCTGQCPGNMPSGFARCTCSNGVSVIGKLNGGSCDQLCACTGNNCTSGSCGGPTSPPTTLVTPTPKPTPTASPSPTPTRSPSPTPTRTPTPTPTSTCLTCQYQSDLYWGPAITSFAGGVRYSTTNRLIVANSVTSTQPVCALNPVSVLPTPTVPVLSAPCANPVGNGYLTGAIDNSHTGGTEGYLVGTVTNHSTTCTYDVGFASYKTNGATIDTQNLYDNKSISLAPGQTQKIYIKSPKVNDAASCHTIPVTSTPSPIVAQCLSTNIFSQAWAPISIANFQNLPAGGKVYFCTKGTSTGGTFDKARFTINGVLRSEVTLLRPGTTEFCDLYTIPANTYSFAVQGEVHHVTLGWR